MLLNTHRKKPRTANGFLCYCKPYRIEPLETKIPDTAHDVKKDREQVSELINHRPGERIVLVQDLQCIKTIDKKEVDRKSKYTNT